ncbi:MAG: hypothetical protein A2636_01120 [Elusimicrobia bacterium RIFCSPHIGHO2_01_FULL_64_10]|nr:MAG: hypothetical protein A2636_01120 [Elusimicrobia bacterium RIFCSPHIGHO2_01_FULL_64_10]
MIRQWEILHAPSGSDARRHRLSMWSDGPDVENIRQLLSGRAGVVWVPRRSPYNCAFFVYGLTDAEKTALEGILSGKMDLNGEDFRAGSRTGPSGQPLGPEDTQEVIRYDAIARPDSGEVTGLGKVQSPGAIAIAYILPEHFPAAGDQIHDILEKTLYDKKIGVNLEKKLSIIYHDLSLPKIYALLKSCREASVRHAIAVGDPARLQGLKRVSQDNGIFVRLISESVLDRHLWLTVIAEILSFE